MMEKGPDNSNEQPLVNSDKKEIEVNASRRSFFGKAAALVTVAALGVKAKDVLEKESNLIKLSEKYNKKEIENLPLVNEAADKLLDLMNKKKINDDEIRISGTVYPDNEIEILRNFLGHYLTNSQSIRKTMYKDRLSVSDKAFFSRKLLTDILSATTV